jgi:hypothetical protein
LKHGEQCSVVKQQLILDIKIHFEKHYYGKKSNQNGVVIKHFIDQKNAKEKEHHDKHDSHKQGVIKLPIFHCFIF